MHATAGRDQPRVVIGPRRARELEHALALSKALLRLGVGVEEDVPVIERGDELDVTRKQHAVAEHVAGHVADAGDGEIGRLRVYAHLAEMPLDRFPGAARGDAHHLVVVAGRSSRGEGVAQPEAVFLADGIGVVGKCRGSLVRRDDEIGIVGVVAFDLRRRNDLIAHAVVGEIEKAPQVVLIAGDALPEIRFAIGRRRRTLEHEAALGADRNDDRILDHLRLDQAQHLGTEVLRPVGPAQAAARDPAAAQVHALEARRVDEDLELRLGLGQSRNLPRIELERYEPLAAALGIPPPEVGPGRGLDEREILAQHAILGEILDRFERGFDSAYLLRGAHADARALGRVEAQLEQPDEISRNVRVRRERCLDERL